MMVPFFYLGKQFLKSERRNILLLYVALFYSVQNLECLFKQYYFANFA